MRILAIETSCDETAVALLEISGRPEKPDIKVLGNSLFSQVHIHEKYGGVYPNLAKREHEINLPILLKKTLEEAGKSTNWQTEGPDIDFIAVTNGPGLEPALWVGIKFAEELGEKWGKPVVPVNHMEGHMWSVLFEARDKIELPALALLISGGHTELVHARDFGDYEIIGRTRDDAVGEAFDKAARMLGLSYPGGPKISAMAELSRERDQKIEFEFPRPMIHSKDLDFSYSGLKTSMLYKLRKESRDDSVFREDMARAFEEAAVDVLVEKTKKALEKLSGIKTLIIAGGVSASPYVGKRFKDLLEKFPEIELRIPARTLATDNAVMIGIAGFIKAYHNKNVLTENSGIRARGNLSISYLQV